MHICRRVVTAFAIALVLTAGIPSVASATVFFCGSGDVGVACLINSIESANAGQGADTIILEAGTYTFTVADNTVDNSLGPGGGRGNALPSITGRVTIQGAGPTDDSRWQRLGAPFSHRRIGEAHAAGSHDPERTLTLCGCDLQSRDADCLADGGPR